MLCQYTTYIYFLNCEHFIVETKEEDKNVCREKINIPSGSISSFTSESKLCFTNALFRFFLSSEDSTWKMELFLINFAFKTNCLAKIEIVVKKLKVLSYWKIVVVSLQSQIDVS